jgi:hypothetical protein
MTNNQSINDHQAAAAAAASEWREACVCLLPRLPLSLTVAGVGVGALLRLAYCWAPLWAAVAFVLLPSLAQVTTTTTTTTPLRCGRGLGWVGSGGRVLCALLGLTQVLPLPRGPPRA